MRKLKSRIGDIPMCQMYLNFLEYQKIQMPLARNNRRKSVLRQQIKRCECEN